MTIMDFTETFDVRRLQEEDIPRILELMKGNPQYFETCPPLPDHETVRDDLHALPPETESSQKYYLGIFNDREMICVIDLITGYPQPETVWIGFFMMAAEQQRKGIGSALLQKILAVFQQAGYLQFQLGCMENNKQAEMFWIRNGFDFTGETRTGAHGSFRIMQRIAGENV